MYVNCRKKVKCRVKQYQGCKKMRTLLVDMSAWPVVRVEGDQSEAITDEEGIVAALCNGLHCRLRQSGPLLPVLSHPLSQLLVEYIHDYDWWSFSGEDLCLMGLTYYIVERCSFVNFSQFISCWRKFFLCRICGQRNVLKDDSNAFHQGVFSQERFPPYCMYIQLLDNNVHTWYCGSVPIYSLSG